VSLFPPHTATAVSGTGTQNAACSHVCRVNQCIVVDCVWQWQEVLDILADALNDNNIKYRMLHASRKFEVTAFCYHET